MIAVMMVAPLVGARIEIVISWRWRFVTRRDVAPLVGARIEIDQ